MDTLVKLFNDITSWYWWISVVLVGLAINLGSSYIRPSIDGWYEKRSERKRLSSEVERAEFEATVASLVANPFVLVIEAVEELRGRTRFLFLFIATLFLFSIPMLLKPNPTNHASYQMLLGLGSMLAGFYAFALALSALNQATKRAHVIAAAKTILLKTSGDVA